MTVAPLCGPVGRHSTNTINAALGIVCIYEAPVFGAPISFDLFLSYNFVALSLNVLLTLMIVMRIVWHRRNFQNAVGTSAGAGGLYATVITMLAESCALYTVASLLYLALFATDSEICLVFTWAVGPSQVRTAFALTLVYRYIESCLTMMVCRSSLPISSF